MLSKPPSAKNEISKSNDDFDKVARSDKRYSYVDENNLGFADRVKGVAYVRQTGVHDLNKYLISHELEELEQDESTHEDPNGIRHKKFFKQLFLPFLKIASAFIPFVGSSISSGLSKYFDEINNFVWD